MAESYVSARDKFITAWEDFVNVAGQVATEFGRGLLDGFCLTMNGASFYMYADQEVMDQIAERYGWVANVSEVLGGVHSVVLGTAALVSVHPITMGTAGEIAETWRQQGNGGGHVHWLRLD
jgi:hypothetical protein